MVVSVFNSKDRSSTLCVCDDHQSPDLCYTCDTSGHHPPVSPDADSRVLGKGTDRKKTHRHDKGDGHYFDKVVTFDKTQDTFDTPKKVVEL